MKRQQFANSISEGEDKGRGRWAHVTRDDIISVVGFAIEESFWQTRFGAVKPSESEATLLHESRREGNRGIKMKSEESLSVVESSGSGWEAMRCGGGTTEELISWFESESTIVNGMHKEYND